MKFKSKKNQAYIIAEVGQNHQGDLDLAKKYIKDFANAGADAVKFQKRDINSLFRASALIAPYESPNAFGDTYGEHRAALEFSKEQMSELKIECELNNVEFMCTAFDEVSLNELIDLGVDTIKVASFDMGNVPFLSKIAQSNVKFILSAGGASEGIVDQTIEYLISKEADFSILHCVSRYPCGVDELALGRVSALKKKYPNVEIGLSDHFNGILSGPIGYMKGARLFEKHVTYNRAWKGTDHPFALTVEGFSKFVRDINRVPLMTSEILPSGVGGEYVFKKLGKTLHARVKINEGEVFTEDNLSGIINKDGIPVRESFALLKRISKKQYEIGDCISLEEI